jgi:hypothetical protein
MVVAASESGGCVPLSSTSSGMMKIAVIVIIAGAPIPMQLVAKISFFVFAITGGKWRSSNLNYNECNISS